MYIWSSFEISWCFNNPGILKAVQSHHTWNNGIMCLVLYWVGNILGIMAYVEMTIFRWSDINDDHDENIDENGDENDDDDDDEIEESGE